MKRKIMTVLTVVFALSLVFTVYALNKTNVSPPHRDGADCCAKKDSCPMKNGDAKSEKASCCDKSDSCPMKKSEDKQTTASLDMTNVTVVTGGENCCQSGADCCQSGSCCKGKHDKK